MKIKMFLGSCKGCRKGILGEFEVENENIIPSIAHQSYICKECNEEIVSSIELLSKCFNDGLITINGK